MKKTPYPGILFGLLMACLCVACSPLATQVLQLETEAPSPTARPAETATRVVLPTASPTETPTLEPLLTASLVPVTPTSQFAPICKPDVASTLIAPLCQQPIAEQSSTFCMSKKPYNLILIDARATYEVLNEGFECSQAGMKDGRQILMCNGPIGTPFDLRVCSQQACTLPTLVAQTSQCPPEFLYYESQGCCAHIPQSAETNCVLLSLQTKSCVTNCAEYTGEAACNNHWHTCQWNDEDNVCQLRP